MGNETSSEYQQAYGAEKTPRGGVRRSSSLRTNRPSAYLQQSTSDFSVVNERKNFASNCNSDKDSVESSVKKKQGAPVKRSNTFTAISTFARPLFQSSSNKLSTTNHANDEETTKKMWRSKWRSSSQNSQQTDIANCKKQKKVKSSSQRRHQNHNKPISFNEWDEASFSSATTDENDDVSLNTTKDEASSITTEDSLNTTNEEDITLNKNKNRVDNGQLFVPRKTSTTTTAATAQQQQQTTMSSTAVPKTTTTTTTTTTTASSKNATKFTITTKGKVRVRTSAVSISSHDAELGSRTSLSSTRSSQVTTSNTTIADDVKTILEEKPANISARTINENNRTTAFHSSNSGVVDTVNSTSNDNTLANAAIIGRADSNSTINSESSLGDAEEQTEKLSESDLDTPATKNDNMAMEETCLKEKQRRISNASEGEEGRKYCTPSEKRRKNVLRSRSMNYHMNRPKLSDEHRSNSIDDKLGEIDSTDSGQHPSTSTTPSLGGRRSSDSSLLKEQYVKQAEQFTILLKQFRQQREKRLKLSGNALGVITENTVKEETESHHFKTRRKNDYIDAWLKDQTRRIEVLAEAVKGDPEKVRCLRASFRERSLRCPQKDLLPQRPSSTKLPRRKNNFAALISSSDSDELEENFHVRKTESGCCYLDNNGNMITKKQQSTLKKQLSDTLILVDNSFKHIKNKDQCQQRQTTTEKEHRPPPLAATSSSENAIKFQTSSSILGKNGNGTNVAVVKPMKRINTNACAENNNNKSKFNNPTYNQVIKKTDFAKPITDPAYQHDVDARESDKEEITTHSAAVVGDGLIETKNNLPNAGRIATIDNTTAELQNCQGKFEDTDLPPERLEKRNENEAPSVSDQSSDVDRISKSLNQVMGDLKTLRDQDIDLAKQLLGLGKSIKDFKKEQKDRTSIILEQDDGAM